MTTSGQTKDEVTDEWSKYNYENTNLYFSLGTVTMFKSRYRQYSRTVNAVQKPC